MPIKSYKCNSCSKGFEKLILIESDESDITCPSCNSFNCSRSFWGQTIAISKQQENKCCMDSLGVVCPQAEPGGG